MKVALITCYLPHESMAASVRLKRFLSMANKENLEAEIIGETIIAMQRLKIFWPLFFFFKAKKSNAQVFYISAPPLRLMITAGLLLLFDRRPEA
jgi:hypothetical protein